MVAKRSARVAAQRVESAGVDAEAGTDAGGNAPLELRPDAAEDAERVIARALRARRPDLGAEAGEQAGAAYLAASLLAYAADRRPISVAGWRKLLAEVLADAGCVLDDDDNEDAIRAVIDDLRRKRVLEAPKPRIEPGAIVLALLAEDDDWHEAAVQRDIGDGNFLVVFLEYGKPQETPAANIRPMDTVVDDDGAEETLREGKCEMCRRHQMLTFHHLIPKDTHPTYLKKRLPPGIEGEPTRGFLNSHGTMVCRQCHAYIHHTASNDVLAREYNTLQKLLEHPAIARWVAWASQQHRAIY